MGKLLSIIIPVFNEEMNLPVMKDRLDLLISKLKTTGTETEVIFADDHSTDNTSSVLKNICANESRYKFIRLSKNSGSHVAIIAGFSFAKGDSAVFLASDLQDPPEIILQLLEKWSQGNEVVWAYRKGRKGVGLITKIMSGIFKSIFNRSTSLPADFAGADFALLDKKVYTGILTAAGSKPSLGALITWMGFRQSGVEYIKEERRHGKSKWSLSKKLNAFSDAFVGFSYVPLRFMSLFGIVVATAGFIYALLIIFLKIIYQTQIEGWASLMVVVLVLGGIQMVMLGVLGEYLWRNLEESRKRPLFFIEDNKGF